MRDNKVYTRIQNKTGQTGLLWTNSSIPINEWHFVMITFDGTTIRMYIDGNEDVSKAFSGEVNETNHSLFAGTFNRGTDPATPSLSYFFEGILDNVMIFNRTLSATDITKLFQLQGAEIPDGEVPEGGITFHHSDHLGSASISTNETGDIVNDIRYYPYGETRYEEGGFEQKYKYNDKEEDDETGLYYYGARYYDSGIVYCPHKTGQKKSKNKLR